MIARWRSRDIPTPRQPPAPPEPQHEPHKEVVDGGADTVLTINSPAQGTAAPAVPAEILTAHVDFTKEISERTENLEDKDVADAAERSTTGGTGSLQPGAAAAEADPPPAKKRRKPGPKSAAEIRAEVGLRK